MKEKCFSAFKWLSWRVLDQQPGNTKTKMVYKIYLSEWKIFVMIFDSAH